MKPHPRSSVAAYQAETKPPSPTHAYARNANGAGENKGDLAKSGSPPNDDLANARRQLRAYINANNPRINAELLQAMANAAKPGSRLAFFAGKASLLDAHASVSTGSDYQLFGPGLKAVNL